MPKKFIRKPIGMVIRNRKTIKDGVITVSEIHFWIKYNSTYLLNCILKFDRFSIISNQIEQAKYKNKLNQIKIDYSFYHRFYFVLFKTISRSVETFQPIHIKLSIIYHNKHRSLAKTLIIIIETNMLAIDFFGVAEFSVVSFQFCHFYCQPFIYYFTWFRCLIAETLRMR